MGLAESSVPKKNLPAGECGAEFGTVRSLNEAVAGFCEARAGKTLFVADRGSFPFIAFAVRRSDAVSAVIGRDALPLFAMPETSGVFAVGGRHVMAAARLYASVRRTPCMLFPTESGLFGAFGQRERAVLGGAPFVCPLAEAEVCFDGSLIGDFQEGYARLLLGRLALFEQRALWIFGEREKPAEEPFRVLMDLGGEMGQEEILRRNALLRRMDFEEGEGNLLAGEIGAFAAFETLLKLYLAFFRCGGAMHTVVCNYEARAAAAGVPFSAMRIPSEETFTRRTLVFEARRGELLRELNLIAGSLEVFRRNYRLLGGKTAGADVAAAKYLPERSGGLSAIIRDFGLMEKL